MGSGLVKSGIVIFYNEQNSEKGQKFGCSPTPCSSDENILEIANFFLAKAKNHSFFVKSSLKNNFWLTVTFNRLTFGRSNYCIA